MVSLSFYSLVPFDFQEEEFVSLLFVSFLSLSFFFPPLPLLFLWDPSINFCHYWRGKEVGPQRHNLTWVGCWQCMWVLLIYRMPGCVWVLSTNTQTHMSDATLSLSKYIYKYINISLAFTFSIVDRKGHAQI